MPVNEREIPALDHEGLRNSIAQLTDVINLQNSMLRDLLSRERASENTVTQTHEVTPKTGEPKHSVADSNNPVNSDGSLKLESVTKESVPTNIRKRKPPTSFCS